MSWLNKISQSFEIITGDGITYTVAWKNPGRTKEFNISEFEFIDVPGTLAKRTTPKGRKYTLEFYFQGENHLDFAAAFDESADDPRAWNINHPYYGKVLVQPLSITIDNSDGNVSKFIVPVVETIDEVAPRIVTNPARRVRDLSDTALTNFSAAFILAAPTTLDIPDMLTDAQAIYDEAENKIKLTTDASAYFNTFREAYAAIQNVVTDVESGIRLMQTMINAPALFVDSVKNRVNILVEQVIKLGESVDSLLSVFDKKRHEQFSGAAIGAMCVASVTEPDYRNRSEVIAVIDLINGRYGTYIEELDSLQSDNGGSPDSYVPDQASMSALNDLVNFTVANLFTIAFSAKKERTVFIEEDSNLILLAHRFYGLTLDDATIKRLIEDNGIGLNEVLQIKKGRAITYTA